jgi:adenosylhomocysteine nucleosidase
MIFPNQVLVSASGGPLEARFWFDVDPVMLEVARQVAGTAELSDVAPSGERLAHTPRVVVGGAGVSGSVFVDNADFRSFAHAAFGAEVLDMESAAVAHVAYVNGVPFIAFRSLSDLAGGDGDANQIHAFLGLAAKNSAAFLKAFLRALPQLENEARDPP